MISLLLRGPDSVLQGMPPVPDPFDQSIPAIDHVEPFFLNCTSIPLRHAFTVSARHEMALQVRQA